MVEEKHLDLGRWVKSHDKKWTKSSIRKILKTVHLKVRSRLKKFDDRIEYFLKKKDN